VVVVVVVVVNVARNVLIFPKATSTESPLVIPVVDKVTPSYIIHLAFSYVGHSGQTSAVRIVYKFNYYCCILGCSITLIPNSFANSGSINGKISLLNCDMTGIISKKYLVG
jgi:hypothetical protein